MFTVNTEGKPYTSVPAEARHHPALVADAVTAVERLNNACVARERQQWIQFGSYERNLACEVPSHGGACAVAADPLSIARLHVCRLQDSLSKTHAARLQHEVTGDNLYERFRAASALRSPRAWICSQTKFAFCLVC